MMPMLSQLTFARNIFLIMKAFVLTKNGGIENLVLSELPMPEAKPDEVVIRTRAISINRVDAFVRQNDFAVGVFYKPEPDEGSIVLGWDVSGVVTQVGDAVTEFKVGDEVFGLVNFFGRGRTNAEYVAAPAAHLAKKPENISHEEAAGAGLTALTAWLAILTYGQVKRDQNVLIHGAAGGVGHFAVQLARMHGARVIGTGSAESEDFVRRVGADQFVDYRVDRPEKIFVADLVVDPMPGDHVLRSLEAVRPGGRVISLLPYDDADGRMAALVNEKDVYTHRVVVSSNGALMKEIAALLASGALKTHVSKIYPFEELPMAHAAIESGKTKGKLIVSLR